MNQHLVEDALRDVFDANEATAGVEADDLEMLDGVEAVRLAQRFGNPFGRVQHRRFTVCFLAQPLGEKKGRADGSGFAFADPFQLLEFFELGPGERSQAAKPLHEQLGRAGTGEGGQKFGVGRQFDGLHGIPPWGTNQLGLCPGYAGSLPDVPFAEQAFGWAD